MKPEVTIEAVRTALEQSLGAGRLSAVSASEPLLASGLISSIDLVTILVDLEKHFEVQMPSAGAAAASLTLGRLVELLGGAPVDAPMTGVEPALARAIARPFVALGAAVVFFFAIDRGVNVLVETVLAEPYAAFLEHGERLYPVAGSYAHDDFSFALAHHSVSVEEATPSILFFGDSGTVGSFAGADESIPAFTGARLGRGRVHNLAWFGRLLAKDLMLLEGVWDRRFDVAVFTIGDDTFSKHKVRIWIEQYRHISFNTPLYDRFVDRIPEGERAPFARVSDQLHAADHEHGGELRRFTFAHVSLMHYRPFLQFLILDRALPEEIFSSRRWDAQRTSRTRCFAGEKPKEQAPGLPAKMVDEDQIEILESTIRLLSRRGVRTVLYVEPFGPSDWPVRTDPSRRTASSIAREVAERTGAIVVDLSFSVGAYEFMDSPAHYVPGASSRIGESVADALEEAL